MAKECSVYAGEHQRRSARGNARSWPLHSRHNQKAHTTRQYQYIGHVESVSWLCRHWQNAQHNCEWSDHRPGQREISNPGRHRCQCQSNRPDQALCARVWHRDPTEKGECAQVSDTWRDCIRQAGENSGETIHAVWLLRSANQLPAYR